ncbi:hypothetical protein ABIB26_004263 [Arthrobacter sp. UYEF20]
MPLAKAHQVPLDELVGAPTTGDPRVHLRPIINKRMTIVPLTRRPGGVQAYKLVLNAGGPEEPTPPGEAAEFDTRIPHWFGRADTRPVEFISLFGRQGERMHVRAKPARG